jgi:flagellar motor switch protein FliG
MATTTTSPAPLTAEVNIDQMTKEQKLAALLVILGPDNAAQILKTLDEDVLQKVLDELARMPLITQELQQDILAEFSDVAVLAGSALRGGVGFARTALERAVGTTRSTNLLERIAPGHAATSFMQQFSEKDPTQIFNALRDEQPQIAALTVSFLPAVKASQVLAQFKPEQRERIIERIATLRPTSAEVVERLGETLVARIGTGAVQSFSQSGGVKSTAALLNAMDREASKSLLVALEKRNPELGQAIRQKMFTFADLIKLDVSALQLVMREIDPRTLAMACKGAGDALKAKLLSAISKRAAEGVNEEISMLGRVKLRDIEAAQMAIIEAVRRLEESGDIELNPEET